MYRKRYPRKGKGYSRRRRYKRRYSTKRKISPGKAYQTVVNKSDGYMPAKFITRHTYNTPINYSLVSGSVTTQIYRGNGLNDPDQSGAGTTASGYTLLNTAYSYNRVYACSIEATVCNTGDIPIIFFIVPTRTATALTLVSAKSYSMYKEVICAEQSGGSSIKKLYHYARTGDIMDISTRDFDLQAASGGNPTQQWYWVCGMSTVDGVSVGTGTVSVRITYYTEWNSLKAQAT